MRNFVSFEWGIGNREHLTRDSLQKCHKIYLKPWLLFRSLIPSYFYSRNSWIIPMTFLMLTSMSKCVFLKKLFVLSSWNTHQTLLETEKNPFFPLLQQWCQTEYVNCKIWIWIYASRCFHHDMTILFLPWH